MAEMKFYIFKQLPDPDNNDELTDYPMCWDKAAVQFDTEESAQRFLDSCKENSDPNSEFYKDAFIKECIFFYDGGHINCEDKTIIMDDISGELLLVEAD